MAQRPDPYLGPEERRRLIPALQRAIENTFSDGDWKHLAYETGTDDWILNHPRLLRSLHWQDPDYGGHVFDAIEQILQRSPENLTALLRNGKIRDWLKTHQPDVYSEFTDDHSFVPTFTPPTPTPREVLVRAIQDAETLIATSGPGSALDRVHTALHTYLLAACDDHGISHSADPGVTELFKLLREQHPGLKNLGTRSQDLEKIMRGLASIVDALNPLRNKASMAHPTAALLGDDEAMLAINATRTLLHYLSAKL